MLLVIEIIVKILLINTETAKLDMALLQSSAVELRTRPLPDQGMHAVLHLPTQRQDIVYYSI